MSDTEVVDWLEKYAWRIDVYRDEHGRTEFSYGYRDDKGKYHWEHGVPNLREAVSAAGAYDNDNNIGEDAYSRPRYDW
jgi:hypothetical protein